MKKTIKQLKEEGVIKLYDDTRYERPVLFVDDAHTEGHNMDLLLVVYGDIAPEATGPVIVCRDRKSLELLPDWYKWCAGDGQDDPADDIEIEIEEWSREKFNRIMAKSDDGFGDNEDAAWVWADENWGYGVADRALFEQMCGD